MFARGMLLTVGKDALSADAFVARGAEDEDRAFAAALALLEAAVDAGTRAWLTGLEARSAWLGLAERHPEASGAAEVRTLLDAPHASDLQAHFVEALSEWPLSDYGLRSIAEHCGFLQPEAGVTLATFDRWRRRDADATGTLVMDAVDEVCRATAAMRNLLLKLPLRSDASEWRSPPEVEESVASSGQRTGERCPGSHAATFARPNTLQLVRSEPHAGRQGPLSLLALPGAGRVRKRYFDGHRGR